MANIVPKTREEIIAVVRKLLMLADRERNDSEYQAEVALQKAHDFIEKHGLAMAELHHKEGTNWDIKEWQDEERSQYDTYTKILAFAVGRLFNCQNYINRSGKWNKYRVRMGYIGDCDDIAMAKEVWPWLTKKVKRLARAYSGVSWTPSHRTFAESFARRIYMRIDQMVKEDEEKTQPKQNGDVCTALVIAEKKDAIQEWLKERGVKFRKDKRTGPRGSYDHNAALAGNEAALHVNLNFKKGVGDGNN